VLTLFSFSASFLHLSHRCSEHGVAFTTICTQSTDSLQVANSSFAAVQPPEFRRRPQQPGRNEYPSRPCGVFPMAAALQLPSTSDTQLPSRSIQDSYSRRLTMTDLDLKDTPYPTFSSASRHTPALSSGFVQYSGCEMTAPSPADGGAQNSPTTGRQTGYNEAWVPDNFAEVPNQQPVVHSPHRRDVIPQTQSPSLAADVNGSYLTSLPPFASLNKRDLPRDSNDDDSELQLPPSRTQTQPAGQGFPIPEMGQRASGLHQLRDDQYLSSSPRHPSLPAAGIGAGTAASGNPPSPIVPMSAGPSYSPAAAAASMAIPISPKPRAFAQQPTYINPPSANPVYAPPQVPREEICVECAMRDQDMADVDVTSPGVWERESDALYEELLKREELEEMAGFSTLPENNSRPRAKGHNLTVENLKMWMSVVSSHLVLCWFFMLSTFVAIRTQRSLHHVNRPLTSTSRHNVYCSKLKPRLALAQCGSPA
jgi:hypothetical protein